MKPSRKFVQYLTENRSVLVAEITAKFNDEDIRLRELELAYCRWVTVATFLHAHKPFVARTLVLRYEEYKIDCKRLGVQPLPPWLYDYERCVFLIDVNVLFRDHYRLEQRASFIDTVSERSIAESLGCDTGE